MNGDNHKNLRLLKVVVQPTFVIDDGKTLTEVSFEPIAVSAEDWPRFANGKFAEAAQAYEEQINAESKL